MSEVSGNGVIKETTKSFVERVMEAIKGSDETKIKRFQKKALKSWDKQIRINEDENESVREKIQDLEESLSESVVNINFEQIRTSESTERYVETYTEALNAKLSRRAVLEGEIEKNNAQIKRFNELKKLIK